MSTDHQARSGFVLDDESLAERTGELPADIAAKKIRGPTRAVRNHDPDRMVRVISPRCRNAGENNCAGSKREQAVNYAHMIHSVVENSFEMPYNPMSSLTRSRGGISW